MPTRLSLLSNFVTRFIFNNVSRGLFEEHKLLYSFLVASSILRQRWDTRKGEMGCGKA